MTQEKLDQAYSVLSEIRNIEKNTERQKSALEQCEKFDKYFAIYAEEARFMFNPKFKPELLDLMKQSMECDEAELQELKAQFEQM